MSRDNALITLASSSTIKTVNILPFTCLSLGCDEHFQNRQRKPSYRSAIIIIRQLDISAVRLDDRRTDRQTETKAVGLGRIERLEQPALLHGMDASSAVLHQDLDGSSCRRARGDRDEPLRNRR